jgi:D-xylonolactonase
LANIYALIHQSLDHWIPMSPVVAIADRGDLCGECPLWSPQEEALYWSDITGRKLNRYSWSTHSHEVIHPDLEVGGLALHASEGFVVVNSEGAWLWNPESIPVLILDSVEGRKCSLNDCIADPQGRLFTGSCFFDPNREDYDRGFLARIDIDGSAHIVDEGIRLANGLGFSPDCSTLYFTDSADRVIYAYDYRPSDGRISNRRAFVRVPRSEGIPDGLTVDAEGYVWSARWFGGCIVRYDPEGRVQQMINIPASQSSSLSFGGPNLDDIFVTSAGVPDALSLTPLGYDSGHLPAGGQLFHLNLGIRGKPEYEARIERCPA